MGDAGLPGHWFHCPVCPAETQPVDQMLGLQTGLLASGDGALSPDSVSLVAAVSQTLVWIPGDACSPLSEEGRVLNVAVQGICGAAGTKPGSC